MKSSDPQLPRRDQPPRLAEWLLRVCSPARDRDGLAGDLAEEFRRHHLPLLGARRARRWYWGQVLRSLMPGLDRPTDRSLPRRRAAGPAHKGEGLMNALLQDLRYGLRSLVHAPTFSMVTILTLALAIGVNSAIFSLVSVMILSDMPMRDTDTLGFVFLRNSERGLERRSLSLPDFLEYRNGVRAFSSLAATRNVPARLSGVEEPVRIVVSQSSANLFEVWGTPMHLGRGFLPGEDEPGAPRVVLLSYGTWESRFGSDPDILGRTVKLDGQETTIVGIVTKDLEIGDISRIEMWTQLVLDAGAEGRDQRGLMVTGRLAPGATLEQAAAEIDAISERLRAEYPETNTQWTGYVSDFRSGLASSGFWMILGMMGVAVALVMLIACSNVASMMLARASARERELAVRAALGAGRFRIVRQLLTESAVLSLVAGVLGLGLARLAMLGLIWVSGDGGLSRVFQSLSLNRDVLLFTLTVSLLAPLLFGLVPALQAVRLELADRLRDGARTGHGGRAQRGRRLLVATQVALALSLMVVAGQLIRYMVQIRTADLGYAAENVLTARIELPEAIYATDEASQQFFRDVGARLRTLPGVDSVAWASGRPAAGEVGTQNFVIDGWTDEDPERLPWANVVVTEPTYFDIVQLRPQRGRTFDSGDGPDVALVAVINNEAARRYWPEQDAVGQQLRLGSDGEASPWLRVIGLVSDEVQPNPDIGAVPQIYLPLEQNPRRALAFLLLSRGEPMSFAPAARQAVWAVDPEQPMVDLRTMQRLLSDNLSAVDAMISMFSAFALFALAMAACGIYGVLSFVVAERTREFGIRMALGAESSDVRRMVIRNTLALVVTGLAVGSVGAYLLSRVLASNVGSIEALDPLVYGSVAAVLALVAIASAWLPVLRATRVDPVVALRAE